MARQSTLAAKLKELQGIEDENIIKRDDVVVQKITSRELFQGFLNKKVATPHLLIPVSDKEEMTILEVILGRAEVYLADPMLELSDFQKLLNSIFDKAFDKDEKAEDPNDNVKSLGEVPQENLLDTVIQVVKYLDKDRLEIALNAVNCQLMIKRSNDAKIINT